MVSLQLYSDSMEGHYIAQACNALRSGELIIFPTGTSYAIGCDSLNQRAIERICRIKGINPDKSTLSIICSGISQAADYVRIDNGAFAILKQFTPGPYTFILPASTKLPKAFKGRKTVGVRIPESSVALSLAQTLGNPILCSSLCNATEDRSYMTTDEIECQYGNFASVMLKVGEIETSMTTIINLCESSDPVVLRQGVGDFIM